MAPRTRAARRNSRKISYQEYETTSSSEDEDPQQDEVASERILSSSSLNKRSRVSRSSSRRKVKAPRSGRSASVNNAAHENGHSVVGLNEKIPRWQNLPYHVLATIFQYHNEPSHPSWRAWLVQIALLCKSFVEPALSALYFKLDLMSIYRVVKLYDLLRLHTTDSSLNYRGKVKWLVFGFFSRGKPSPARDLNEIVALTPQLRGIEVVGSQFNSDSTWQQLMQSLKGVHVLLRSWRWVETVPFPRKNPIRTYLSCIYPVAAFETLERVELNQQYGHLTWVPEEFAMSINALPRLKHLTFNLANSYDPVLLLSLISVKLESLEISGCNMIGSDDLALFLTLHGHKLRRLNVNGIDPYIHSVIVNLARSCPQLQDLRIDFDYHGDATNPAGTGSPRLNEIPTWPSTLWRLELLQWGGWTLSFADVYFSSLVGSAASLPNLRHIHIRASLGESGWKSRVRFREMWTRRFSCVFLRPSKPPSPYLQSLSAYQAFKTAQTTLNSKPIVDDSNLAIPGPTAATPCKTDDTGNRRSHRLRQHAGNKQHPSPDSLEPIRHRRRRRRRARESGSDSSSQDSALEDEVEGSPDDDTSETRENLFIQGLCDVVDIQFDNLRPSEKQLRESDFLDEEVSGDEDWNGSEST